MRTSARVATALALIGWVTIPVQGQQKGRWGSPDDPTVKAMIAMEKMWADGNCGPQVGLKDVFADEFRGTGTDGRRYGKAEAIATDMNALDRDCRFGEVQIQFFGDSVAVAYGNESSLRKEKVNVFLVVNDSTRRTSRADVASRPATIRSAWERGRSARTTTPEDVARCLVALCHPATYWMTGNTLRNDGGESIVE